MYLTPSGMPRTRGEAAHESLEIIYAKSSVVLLITGAGRALSHEAGTNQVSDFSLSSRSAALNSIRA